MVFSLGMAGFDMFTCELEEPSDSKNEKVRGEEMTGDVLNFTCNTCLVLANFLSSLQKQLH